MRSSSPRSRASGSPVSAPATSTISSPRRAQARGGAAQQRRAGGAIAQRGVVERALGGVDRGRDVGGTGLVVRREPGVAGARVDGVEGRGHALYGTRFGARTSDDTKRF